MKGLLRLCCGLAAALITPAAGLADGVEACRSLKEQRDALASEAMRAEIALITHYRQQRCPELNSRAELANANSQVFAPIDYQALLQCRQAAEQQLERENPVLYRNRLGFTFYSAGGSAFARQADQRLDALQQLKCSL
jgi:hypothetical protein